MEVYVRQVTCPSVPQAKVGVQTVNFVRDHNHDRQNYSSHCRYVFLPFVEDVIKEDAWRDPIGVVSHFSIEGKYYFMNHEL